MSEFLPEEFKSKTQSKREALALKELGIALTKLPLTQLAKIPLDSTLRSALEFAKTISSNGAKRRHMQYIARLLRATDAVPIQQALITLTNQDQQSNARFHRLEKLRDELISQGDTAMVKVLTSFPQADRQILRQLIRKAQKTTGSSTSAAAARALFRYLRQLADEQKP